MADISDGLSVGGDDIDFSAALARAVGQEPETPATPDPDATPATPEEPAATPETPEGDPHAAGDEEDPEVAAYLARYGGDEGKALRAAVEAQKLIGRQGQELGAVRQEIQALREQFEEASYEDDPPAIPGASQVSEEIEQFVERVGGQSAATWALQNRPDLYDQVIDAWSDRSMEDQRAAMRYDNRYQAALAAEMAKLDMAPVEDPSANARRVKDMTAESFGVLRQELGEEWDELAPFVQEAINDVPRFVQKSIAEPESVESQTDALRVVVLAARARATGAGGEAAAQQRAADIAAKKTASLGGGSLTPRRGTAKTGDDSADAIAAFKRGIAEADNTSIFDNITVGGK